MDWNISGVVKRILGGEKKALTLTGVESNFFSSPPLPPLSTSAINQNSVIGACLRPLTAATGQGILEVQKSIDGEWIGEQAHIGSKLLRAPSAATPEQRQSYERFLWGLCFSDVIDGNAYAYKLRNASGRVIGLQYIPHTSIEPIVDTGGVPRTYQVMLNTGAKTVPSSDIIHIAYGVDPDLLCKGVSPIKCVMRYVMTDNQIAQYAHAIMKNPSPGYVLALDGDTPITDQQRETLNASIKRQVAGENSGGIVMLPGKAQLMPLKWTPDDMGIDKMSDLPEERICACMGVPPIVANLGSGLARSTFSNFEEAQKAFYLTTVAGFWNRVSTAFTEQLLPELEGQAKEGLRFGFKTDHIGAMQESQDAKVARAEKLFRSNMVDRKTALSQAGLPYDEKTDAGVYAYMLGPQAFLALNGGKMRGEAEASV